MMARAIHAVLGCRVVLHIREQIQQQRYKGIMQNMHYLRSNSDINWTCDELAGG
ncbi:hypothetical protein AN958_08518 [Leucoagaricus sp. SymC.cos]|nr:hypothetical protein AN958_08518 [Leucoagaricus sp. SymC.cos]